MKYTTEYLTKTNLDTSELHNYHDAKKYLSFLLINYERNKKWLKDVLTVPFLNLAIVPFLYLNKQGEGIRTLWIQDSDLALWNVGIEELIQDAITMMSKNYPAKLNTMQEAIREETFAIDEVSEEEEDTPMYVLRNRARFGAGCLLYDGIVEKYAKKLGGKIYILPSSIHELILIPLETVKNPVELITTVCDINKIMPSYVEVLSNQIYMYDPDTDRISMLDERNDARGVKVLEKCSSVPLTRAVAASISIFNQRMEFGEG